MIDLPLLADELAAQLWASAFTAAGGFALRRIGAGLDERFERALPTTDLEVPAPPEPLLAALGRLLAAAGAALVVAGAALFLLELIVFLL